MNYGTVVITDFTCVAKIYGISIKGKIPITSVQIQGGVNRLPMVNLTIYPNNGTSRISPEELIALAKECQGQLLKGLSSTNPNVDIEISMDGQGIASDEYKLRAILYGVDLHMDTNAQSIYVTIKATTPDVLLNCIDLSIYNRYSNLNDHIKNQMTKSDFDNMPLWARVLFASEKNYSVQGKPVTQIIHDMVSLQMQKWEDIKKETLKSLKFSEQQTETILSIHENNKSYIQRLYDFLKASNPYTSLLDGAPFAENKSVVKGVLTGIATAMYSQGLSPLSAMMNYLTSNFGVWYTGNLHGDMMGKMKNQPFLETAPDKSIDIACTSVEVEINQDQVRPPVGQILMSANTINTAPGQYHSPSNANTIYVRYPEKKIEGGITYSLSGPSWLITETAQRGEVTPGKYDRNYDQAADENKEETDKAIKEGNEANAQLLQYMAKKEFFRAKYQNSLLMVSSVINTDITTDSSGLGDFFKVKSLGTPIGNAVMSNVQHTFTPNSLTTQVGFTMLQL